MLMRDKSSGKTLTGKRRDISSAEDFSVSLSQRSTPANGQSPGSQTTVNDAVLNSYTGATANVTYDISVTFPTNPLTRFQQMTITNVTPGYVTFDSVGRSTWVGNSPTNGASALVSIAGTGKKLTTFTTSTTGGQNITVLNHFVSGSLGAHLVAQISDLITGLTPPTFTQYNCSQQSGICYSSPSLLTDIYTNYPTQTIRNTAGWWGTVDLTAIPRRLGLSNATLITPQHMLGAWHIESWYSSFIFDGNSASYTRNVTSVQQILGLDIALITLDSPLPSDVIPLKLLPSNWRTYLPQGQYGYPCVYTNADRRLFIGDTTEQPPLDGSWLFGSSTDAIRSAWTTAEYSIRSGDSGSPVMMLINGELVNISNITGVGYGAVDSDYISQINTAIGGSYTVSTVDLSGFSSY